MAGSIGDWYTNASEHERGNLRYDWQHDDPAEGAPVPWPDGYPVRRGRASGTKGRRAARSAGIVTTRRGAIVGTARSSLADGSDEPKLAAAARRIRANVVGISMAWLTQRLRQNGWPDVTEERVRSALHGRRTAQPAAPRPILFPIERAPARPAVKRAAGTSRPPLAAEIGRLQAAHHGIAIKGLTRRLRADGWWDVTQDQVRTMLEATPATRRSRPDHSEPRRADTCPSCGTAISILGICRCS